MIINLSGSKICANFEGFFCFVSESQRHHFCDPILRWVTRNNQLPLITGARTNASHVMIPHGTSVFRTPCRFLLHRLRFLQFKYYFRNESDSTAKIGCVLLGSYLVRLRLDLTPANHARATSILSRLSYAIVKGYVCKIVLVAWK